MNRFIKIIILLFIELILIYSYTLAKEDYLVIIGNEKYTVEDFKWWWEHWKNPEQPLIENLDPYIKWLLFLKEAEKMKLEDDPFYQKKLLFFLKPRVLLRLQYDEVKSKIKITEKDLKNFYNKEFVPIYFVKNFYFEEEKTALEFYKKIGSIDECDKIFEKYEGKRSNLNIRPWNLPENVKKIFNTVKTPKVLSPLKWYNMWVVACVKEINEGDEEDFKRIEGNLREILRKKKEDELTDRLIKKLKKKYKVVLNEALFKKINLDGFPEDIKDEILLQIEDRYLTVEDFYKVLVKEAKLRRKIVDKNDPESVEKFKKSLINNFIVQNLIDIEALNRGYEKKEPLKSQYEFYKKDLLVERFINYVIVPNIKITEDEIRKYYEDYKKNYDIAETVKAIVVETGEEPLIEKINKERKKGKTLESVLKEFGFKDFIFEKDINEYSSEIRNIINSMKPEEIREVKINNKFYLIKVIDKKVNKGYVYEKLKPHIIEIIKKEKYKEEENKIYELLKKEYNVKINYKEWERFKKELSQKES